MSSQLSKKLNFKDDTKVRVIGKPVNVNLGNMTITTSAKAEGIIIFIKTLAEVDKQCAPVIDAAKEDRIAWIVYPKAGQLGTDLNRDILWKHMVKHDIQGVRQIAVDDVWSAMRFRPKK